jgi:hypothetical protein
VQTVPFTLNEAGLVSLFVQVAWNPNDADDPAATAPL